MPLGRRGFLLRALSLGAASFLSPVSARAAAPRFASDPFGLGIASGSPRTDGMVLWTRLAPRPGEAPFDPVAIPVRWEIAEDPAFRRVVRHGTESAEPARAHAVHVEVEGLAPGRPYHYRFMAGDATSAIGRTRTAPEAGKGDDRLRMAYASCQQYEQGYYTAHRHLAAENADLVAFLGDYIYESSWGREHVRKHGAPPPRTLEEYRDRYALYKSDRDLQLSHAACPWIVTWDDHEVENDYANDRSETLDPAFLTRRAVAYRVFLEHMPLRRSVLLEGGGVRLYDRHEWGALATVHMLDGRQYRSHQVCPRDNRGGGNVVGVECSERLEPTRTMLGEAQERWLDEGFGRSRACWNIVGQQTLFAPAGRPSDRGLMHATDGWDGYPGARQRLLKSIADRKPGNPVVISGDVHASYFSELRADPSREASPIVATELCGTSISSQGPDVKRVQGIQRMNPHIRYGNGATRGYMVMDITRKGIEARMRGVSTVKVPDAPVSTIVTARIAEGRPGFELA